MLVFSLMVETCELVRNISVLLGFAILLWPKIGQWILKYSVTIPPKKGQWIGYFHYRLFKSFSVHWYSTQWLLLNRNQCVKVSSPLIFHDKNIELFLPSPLSPHLIWMLKAPLRENYSFRNKHRWKCGFRKKGVFFKNVSAFPKVETVEIKYAKRNCRRRGALLTWLL